MKEQDLDMYAKCAEPYESLERAKAAMDLFVEQFEKLREACRIPEVMCVFGAHYHDEKGEHKSVVHGLVMGDSKLKAQLAAIAYRSYALPELERAERLRRIADGTESDEQLEKKR